MVSTPRHETLPDKVPEADWAEQELVADPRTEEADEATSRTATAGRQVTEADEADLAEQEQIVYTDDDEQQ